MTSTLRNESSKWSHDAIERALAHGDTDGLRAAYHSGTHWKERVAMAQRWSDDLEALRDGRGEDMFYMTNSQRFQGAGRLCPEGEP